MMSTIEKRLDYFAKPVGFFPLGFWILIVAFVCFAALGLYVPRGDDKHLMALVRSGAVITPDWSPIFIVLMHLFLHDRPDSALIFLYLLIFAVQLFILSRLMSRQLRKPLSFFGALLFLFSPASALLSFLIVEQSTYAIFLAQNFFMLAVMVMLSHDFRKKRYFRYMTMVFVVLASLSRPEFLWSLGAFFIYMLFLNWRDRLSLAEAGIDIAIYGFILVLFFGYFGLPIASSDRALMAFGQHYALRQCEAFQAFDLCRNPWSNYKEIMRLGLGEHQSVFEFIIARPSAFFFHCLSNALRLALSLLTLGYGAPNLIRIPNMYLPAMIMTLIIGAIILHDLIRRAMKLKNFSSFDLFLLGSALPFLMSSIVFFPRAHYIATPILIIILIVYRKREAVGD